MRRRRKVIRGYGRLWGAEGYGSLRKITEGMEEGCPIGNRRTASNRKRAQGRDKTRAGRMKDKPAVGERISPFSDGR